MTNLLLKMTLIVQKSPYPFKYYNSWAIKLRIFHISNLQNQSHILIGFQSAAIKKFDVRVSLDKIKTKITTKNSGRKWFLDLLIGNLETPLILEIVPIVNCKFYIFYIQLLQEVDLWTMNEILYITMYIFTQMYTT